MTPRELAWLQEAVANCDKRQTEQRFVEEQKLQTELARERRAEAQRS